MKRMFRSVVAAVVCVLALAPAAWGRMRFSYYTTHPVGDGSGMAASAQGQKPPALWVFLSVPGVKLPIYMIHVGSVPGSKSRPDSDRQGLCAKEARR